MRNPSFVALIPAALLVLSACQGSTIFETVDMTENSVSIDAKQRMIISTTVGDRTIVCAEPSPDALVAISQAFAAEAQVAGKGGGGIAATLNESAATIGLRTATIQLLRDGLYRACEAYRNDAISRFGYGLILSTYDDLLVTMMAIEGLMTMQPAAQVAIGTKGTAAASSAAGEALGADESKIGGKVTLEGEAIAAVFNRPTANKFTESEINALAVPLEKLTESKLSSGSVVGACLMWLSVGEYQQGNLAHDKLLTICETFIDIAANKAK